MKLSELIAYIRERGSGIFAKDGKLFIDKPDRLTPLCKQVIHVRSPELHAHFGLSPPPGTVVPFDEFLKSCPNCGGKVGTDAANVNGKDSF